MKRFLLALLFVLFASSAFAWPSSVGTALVTGGVVADNTTSAAVLIPVDAVELAIEMPTITSATVGLLVSVDNSTFQDLFCENNGTNTIIWTTAAGTAAKTAVVPCTIGIFKYLKVKCGAAQAEDRTFRLIYR